MFNSVCDEQLLHLFEAWHERARYAGHSVVGHRSVGGNHSQSGQSAFVAVRIATNVVVLLLETVEADRDRMQSCTQQTLEAFGRECQRISNDSPRVTTSV